MARRLGAGASKSVSEDGVEVGSVRGLFVVIPDSRCPADGELTLHRFCSPLVERNPSLPCSAVRYMVFPDRSLVMPMILGDSL